MTLIRILWIVFFLMNPVAFYASDNIIIKGRLILSGSNFPIPYATIKSTGTDFAATISSADGTFILTIPQTPDFKDGNIHITGFGCHSKTVSLSSLNKEDNTIELDEKTFEIEKVTVHGQRSFKKKVLGNTTSAGNSVMSLTVGAEKGIFVKNTKRLLLRNIMINIADTSEYTEAFVLRIMNIADNILPNRLYPDAMFYDLLPETIVVKADKPGILDIDIEKFNVMVNGNFIILLSPAQGDYNVDNTFKEGPSIINYSKRIKNIEFFYGLDGKYGYSNVHGITVYSPMISIVYSIN